MATDSEIEYKTVLVIGNGFDINLGLKTSYNDYIQSNNFIRVKHGVPFLEHIEKINKLNNWVDIELELKRYVSDSALGISGESFKKEHEILCSSLNAYLQSLNYKSSNELPTDAVRLLSDFEDNPVCVLNFNYTNTVDFICRSLFHGPKIKEIKMHGSFRSDIIFGVEDNADIPEEYVYLKKSTHPIFKPIDFSNILSNAEEVIFFGYSLGESDHMYFKDFFEEQSRKSTVRKPMKIKIYHFGEESYFQIHSQLDKLTNKNITGLKQHNDVKFKNLKRW